MFFRVVLCRAGPCLVSCRGGRCRGALCLFVPCCAVGGVRGCAGSVRGADGFRTDRAGAGWEAGGQMRGPGFPAGNMDAARRFGPCGHVRRVRMLHGKGPDVVRAVRCCLWCGFARDGGPGRRAVPYRACGGAETANVGYIHYLCRGLPQGSVWRRRFVKISGHEDKRIHIHKKCGGVRLPGGGERTVGTARGGRVRHRRGRQQRRNGRTAESLRRGTQSTDNTYRMGYEDLRPRRNDICSADRRGTAGLYGRLVSLHPVGRNHAPRCAARDTRSVREIPRR